jgi:hypothetical protein
MLLAAPGIAAADSTVSPLPAGATPDSLAEAQRYTEQAHIADAILAKIRGWRTEVVPSLVRLQHMSPEIAASYFDDDVLVVVQENIGDLVKVYVDDLAAAMSADEIRQMEAYLATPIGAKILKVQEQLAATEAKAEFGWEHKILRLAQQKFQSEHPELMKKPGSEQQNAQ